jgi:uncharacterized protein (DUF2141 family)
LTVKINDMRNSKGQILYILFSGEEGFPDDPSKAVRQGKIDVGQLVDNSFLLKDIPSGKYALSVIHDENNNNKLDTNMLGIPKEGVGFSNNPKLMFGAPSYEKCEFVVNKNQDVILNLKHFL